jgi:catechol 2,3-dioxygenase-like lactoylglutathione lyase family enzyme
MLSRQLQNLVPLSSRACLRAQAKRGICFSIAVFFISALLLSTPAAGRRETHRPHITNIVHVQLLVKDIGASTAFYRMTTYDYCVNGSGRFDSTTRGSADKKGYTMTDGCTWLPNYTFFVNFFQTIGLSEAHDPYPMNSIERITFATDNLPELRRYLVAQGLKPSKAQKPDRYLTITDPEGHLIAFTQRYNASLPAELPSLPTLIHAGFVVKDRAAENHFYKDILGFHLYWQGGRKDGETDWVNMQVPDGTDWIEYMLKVPADADHHTLGAMNHIALGVPDIHAAEAQLRKNGWTGTEQPKIGRGGKWMLNLYDPDDTRVEFMEFTPTQKPCCSDYTGPHPKP